jgi:hypothetical protein
MFQNLAEEILVAFLGSLAVGFLVVAIVYFYRSRDQN